MEIKFNCSNSSCRQRISVDELMAGQKIKCPACCADLQVPVSRDIKFNCSNLSCIQHIVVAVSEAGRYVRCPACGKALQVPGDPPKSISSNIIPEQPNQSSTQPAYIHSAKRSRKRLSPFMRLIYGWSLGISLCTLVLIGSKLHSWKSIPRNLDKILDEAYFHGEILCAPVENTAGNAMLYVRTIAGGAGIFLVDLQSLSHTQIGLGNLPNADRSKTVRLFGWSPDDKYVAYSTILKDDQNSHVVICDGADGKPITTFDATNGIEAGSWFSGTSLLLYDHLNNILLFNIESDSRLGQKGVKGLTLVRQLGHSGNAPVPDSDKTIAYIEDGNLWHLSIPNNTATQLTHLTNNALFGDLDYNAVSDKYLFSVTNDDSERAFVCQYDPRAFEAPVTKISNCANYQFKSRWIKNGSGVVYVGMEGNRYCLGLRGENGVISTNLFTSIPFDPGHGFVNRQAFIEGRQVVRTFSVNHMQSKVYVVASINYEPLSIWELDVDQKSIRNVVPVTEPLIFSQVIKPVQASTINEKGKRIDYYYLPPTNIKPGNKYPVVMDQYSDLGFQPNSQFLANVGIFYVTVNPYGRGFPAGPTTPEDAMAVYKEVLKIPGIDPNQIYLSGESAGTLTVANLLTEHPGLWKGAILLSPATFPRVFPTIGIIPRFFVSVGDQDERSLQKQLEKFVLGTCAHRRSLELLYGHSGHAFFDIAEHKKRYKAVAEFVLEGK